MLVLSRMKDEVLCIGDDIEVMVVSIRNGKARLGIKAPANVIVRRKELPQEPDRKGVK